MILSSNEDNDFFRNKKNYETQKAWRKLKNCLSYRQSIGISGVVCYLCQYSLFSEPPAKNELEKSVNLQREIVSLENFRKLVFFSITQQLFAKLLSHSSNRVDHH